MGAKSGSFWANKNFWFTFLSKILVARLVAFTTVDRFSSDYGPQTKRAQKRFRPYFKIAHNCSRTRSEDQCLYANFSASQVPGSFKCLAILMQILMLHKCILASVPLLRLLWRRH